MERPNVFKGLFRSRSASVNETTEVVRNIVWKINGDVPVNKGLRFMVVLEIEDPDNNNEDNKKGSGNRTLEASKVSAGALSSHGYDPYYFTSPNPEALDGKFDNTAAGGGSQDYSKLTLEDPVTGAVVDAGAIPDLSAGRYLGAEEARQEHINNVETVTYKRVLADNQDSYDGYDVTMIDGLHAEVLSEGMKVYTEQEPPAVTIHMDDRTDGRETTLTIGRPRLDRWEARAPSATRCAGMWPIWI